MNWTATSHMVGYIASGAVLFFKAVFVMVIMLVMVLGLINSDLAGTFAFLMEGLAAVWILILMASTVEVMVYHFDVFLFPYFAILDQECFICLIRSGKLMLGVAILHTT